MLKSEYCVNVWDLNNPDHSAGQVGLKPVSRLCFEEATSSLSWLPESPHLLAVGTSMGWVRIFDTRQGEQAAVDVSLMAHPGARHRKVKGIRPDPFHPHLLGTFSDSPQDSVKIWDLRKNVSSKSKLTPVATISPHGGSDGQYNSQSAVTDVAWSTSREDVLAVSTSHHKQVLLYSTAVRSTNPDDVIRTPYHHVPTASAVRSLSWQKGGSTRLLAATSVGVADILVVESVPLAVSAAALAAGTSKHMALALIGGSTELPWRDTEQLMCDRSNCGYSLDASKNMQVLSDELDALFGVCAKGGDSAPSSPHKGSGRAIDALILRQMLQLFHVWGWVDRVESLHDDDVTVTSGGVLRLLKSASKSVESKHIRFHWPIFKSAEAEGGARSRIRQICGWASMWEPRASTGTPVKGPSGDENNADAPEEDWNLRELEDLVETCEMMDSVERAAALSMWHGHPELAIRKLQQHAAHGAVQSGHACGHGWDEPMTPEYQQLLNLVAMCFAGYGGGNMWVTMCESVLAQLNASRRAASAYLAAICHFLLEVLQGPDGATNRFDRILCNDALSLEDRLGFASFYLADAPLQQWVQNLAAVAIKDGRLDGLLLCGLQGDGTRILQEYINRYEDVQSAALLVGRNVRDKLPIGQDALTKLSETEFCEWSWLNEYRSFLNRAKLFVPRAWLDVELGRRQRQRAEVEQAMGQVQSAAGNKSAVKAAPVVGQGIAASRNNTNVPTGDRRASSSRAMYALPTHNEFPHIFLRCNYCSASLPVDAMQQQQHTAFLRKQKPVINFCPNCKKPLPRCYVCQLYIGMVNPHAEVSRILAQKRQVLDQAKAAVRSQSTNATTAPSVKTSLVTQYADAHNVLEFGRWLYFCQRCKHGGHASCIDHWFEGEAQSVAGGVPLRREVCGVNGCDCHCSRN